jgi:hypothetical protein
MSATRAKYRHRTAVRLTPSRVACLIAYPIFAVVLFSAAVLLTLFQRGALPDSIEARLLDQSIEPHPWVWWFVVGTALFGVLFLAAFVVTLRRTLAARQVRTIANEPLPAVDAPAPTPAVPYERRAAAASVPELQVATATHRNVPKPQAKRRRITPTTNVYGWAPISIGYLRIFENDVRTVTFMEGAWREFGPVYMLRSDDSVAPKELREARRAGAVESLVVRSDDDLRTAFAPQAPLAKGSHKLSTVTSHAVRVRDPYGAYPVHAALCSGSYWRQAARNIATGVDLVVLDLSGYLAQNLGTHYELQMLIDCVPIERVLFLTDPMSDEKFLAEQLREAWVAMASGSPNEGTGSRIAQLVCTDYFQRTSSDDGSSQVRLVSRRADTRRVLAAVQPRLAEWARQRGSTRVA